MSRTAPYNNQTGSSGQNNNYEPIRVYFRNKWTEAEATLQHALLIFVTGGMYQTPLLLGALDAGTELKKDPDGFFYEDIFIHREARLSPDESFSFAYSLGVDEDWKWTDKINKCWIHEGSYRFVAPDPMATNRSATVEARDSNHKAAIKAYQTLVNIGSPVLSHHYPFESKSTSKRPLEANGHGCYHIAPKPEKLNSVHNGKRILFLWKLELPAIIDIHTHIMSNNCAPIQAVCEKIPGVGWANVWLTQIPQLVISLIAPLSNKDSGNFTFRPTNQIGDVAHKQAKKSFTELSEFPQYANEPIHSFNALPMDMMFAHYAGYYGVPMLKIEASLYYGGKLIHAKNIQETEDDTEIIDVVRSLAFSERASSLGSLKTTGDEYFRDEPVGSKKFLCRWSQSTVQIIAPKIFDSLLHQYEPWPEQVRSHVSFVKNHPYTALSFYHLDPRRYRRDQTNQLVGATEDIPSHYQGFQRDLKSVWARLVQTDVNIKDIDKAFVGIKMYTSQGYAPYDPVLKKWQTQIYAKCSASNIPILTHCSPEGFKSIDRKYYYDYLKAEGHLTEGHSASAETEYLTTRVYMPKVIKIAKKTLWIEHGTLSGEEIRTKFGGSRAKMQTLEKDGYEAYFDDTQMEYREPINDRECIYWFNHSFVTPRAWEPVVKDHPKLKLCLAHFAGSEHLDTAAEKTQSGYIPFQSWFNKGPLQRTFYANNDGSINRDLTHPHIAQLIDLIKPENRVFVDLSYTIMNTTNVAGFKRLFAWAEKHKPILLERVLWGSDWPLISMEGEIGGGFFRSLGRWFLRAPFSVVDTLDDNFGNHLGRNFGEFMAKIVDFGVDDIFKIFALNQQAFLRLFTEPSSSRHAREIGLEYWIRFTLLNPMQYLNYKDTCDALKEGVLKVKNSGMSDAGKTTSKELYPSWLTNDTNKSWVSAINEISKESTPQADFNKDKLALFMNGIIGSQKT